MSSARRAAVEDINIDIVREESSGTDPAEMRPSASRERATHTLFLYWAADTQSHTAATTPQGKPMTLTALFRRVEGGYAAQVAEIPNAFTQGSTLDEARENLREVLELMIEVNREAAEERFRGGDVVREEIRVTM